MRIIILGTVIITAIVNSTYMALLWWRAALSDCWCVTSVFNGIGEQWIEGVLFHLVAGVSLGAVWYFKPRRGKNVVQ